MAPTFGTDPRRDEFRRNPLFLVAASLWAGSLLSTLLQLYRADALPVAEDATRFFPQALPVVGSGGVFVAATCAVVLVARLGYAVPIRRRLEYVLVPVVVAPAYFVFDALFGPGAGYLSTAAARVVVLGGALAVHLYGMARVARSVWRRERER